MKLLLVLVSVLVASAAGKYTELYMQNSANKCVSKTHTIGTGMYSAGLLFTNMGAKYGKGEECTMTLYTGNRRKISIHVLSTDIGSFLGSTDFLKIYDGPSTSSREMIKLQKGSAANVWLHSSGSQLTVRWNTRGSGTEKRSGVKMSFTAFSDAVGGYCSGSPTESYSCKNSRCVSMALRCDGYDNCGGNKQDETSASCNAVCSNHASQPLCTGVGSVTGTQCRMLGCCWISNGFNNMCVARKDLQG